tara:strand:+ start:528 stop:1031 length:504 start_codon:yes stop_codon:yes gene_type:complete
MKRMAFMILAVGLLLSGCGEEADKPYLEFTGGGFIFNYRIGEAFYGFVAKPRRDIPEGTEIIAEFENPKGGAPITVTAKAKASQLQYTLRTPGVEGVVKDRPYKVVITLKAPGEVQPLAVYEKEYTSSLNQADLPGVALTVGPGYHPNPALYDDKEKAFVFPKAEKQ